MGTSRSALSVAAALALYWGVPMSGMAMDVPADASSGERAEEAPPDAEGAVDIPEARRDAEHVTQAYADLQLLARGRISGGAHVGGVLLALLPLPGFGAGQAVQGRWDHTGKIFAVVDAVLFASFMVTGALCVNSPSDELLPGECVAMTFAGLAWLTGRTAQFLDAFIGPFVHNGRVAEAEARRRIIGDPPPRVGFALSPAGVKGRIAFSF